MSPPPPQTEPGKKFIIGVTGMPGAGKSTAANAVVRMGFHMISMGDVIREETVKRGLQPTDANTGAVMLELREKHGPATVARLCAPKIHSAENRFIVIDGVRSLEEVSVFKSLGVTRLLAVHASPARRYELVRVRSRPDAPLSLNAFQARDERELSVGVERTIALADDVVVNNWITIGELEARVQEIVSRWVREVEG